MSKVSAISQFVPGTQARASRLFSKSLRKKSKGADAVLWVEYTDGDVQLKRGAWDGEINGWVTPQGKRFFPRGRGGDPKRIDGVPIVQCHASDAGVVSTEAAMATGALEEGLVAPLDHRGRVLGPIPQGRTDQDPDAVQREADEAIENGEVDLGSQHTNGQSDDEDEASWLDDDSETDPEQSDDEEPIWDGGQVQPADYLVLYDGVEFRLGDAVDYDPFPVREEDARQAAEWFELAGRDDRSYLRYVAYGAVGSFLIVLGLIGFVWLLGEIGSGDSTGVSLSIGIDSAKLFASIMAATLG